MSEMLERIRSLEGEKKEDKIITVAIIALIAIIAIYLMAAIAGAIGPAIRAIMPINIPLGAFCGIMALCILIGGLLIHKLAK